ncbi:hypothetical protein ACLOJK_010448 [Asimina triloba]
MSNHDHHLASFDEQGRSLFMSRWITVSAVVFFFFAAILTHIFYICVFLHRRERRALSIIYQRMRIAAAMTPPSHGQQTVVVRRRRSISGLESSVIAALPEMSYGKAHENKECAVCLSGLEEGEMVRILPPCMHFFHGNCIDVWLQSNSTCPVCRGDVRQQESTRTAMKSDGS